MSRPRTLVSANFLSPLPRLALEKDGRVTQATLSTLISKINELISRYNGLLSVGQVTDGEWSGSVDGQWRVVDSPAGANTQFIVEHGLGRIPSFFLFGCDRAAIVYANDKDRASWSMTNIHLRCNIVSARIYLLIV